jgi:hypothetical protein
MTCLWLQRQRVINDQEFDSFAFFANQPTDCVMTSRRQKPRNQSGSYPSQITRLITAVGMAISVVGFILNFMGFQGTALVSRLSPY